MFVVFVFFLMVLFSNPWSFGEIYTWRVKGLRHKTFDNTVLCSWLENKLKIKTEKYILS